jgi:hypothetical protein
MIHGGLSGEQPVYRAGLFTVAVGVFVDGARITDPVDGAGRDQLHLDTGGGIRIGVLDGQFGVVRIDVATGLTARRSAITLGLHRNWPLFKDRNGSP